MPGWARETEARLLTGKALPTDRLWADPAVILRAAGLDPDPTQEKLLRSPAARILLLCTRQWGKSTIAAALALKVALCEPGSLTLLLSPSERQSGELHRKVVGLYRALGRPVPLAGPRENQLRTELANGSRVVALPGKEGTVRSFSGVRLLVIDEAARVLDDLYRSVRPMLSVSRGALVGLSTPWGKRGWFFEAWAGGEPWERVCIPADQCPRISREFLAEEEAELGEHFYRQEYFCEFRGVMDSLFLEEDIERAFACDDVQPLFPGA